MRRCSRRGRQQEGGQADGDYEVRVTCEDLRGFRCEVMTGSDFVLRRSNLDCTGPWSADAMSDTSDLAVVEGRAPCCPARPPLAEKALSEAFGRLRYRDTSLLIWQQQQLEAAPPSTYLSRSQSAWYSNYGNQAVLVRDRRGADEGRSRICSIM